MEYNDYYKHISIEDFKKLNVNDISYVQMNNGEIYVIDHPYTQELNVEENKGDKKQEDSRSSEAQFKSENQNKKKKKRKKKNKNKKVNENENENENMGDIISGENKKINDNNNISNNLYANENYYDEYYNNNNDYNYNYDYNQENVNLLDEQNNKSYKLNEDKFDSLNLPNEYFQQSNKKYRSNSLKIKNKRKILFNEEWKPVNEYDIYERMKFYEEIPKRARFWEIESYDATRSSFYSKRLQRNGKYQNNQNQINFNNYTSIKQDSDSLEENDNNYYQNVDTKSNPEENYENNNYNNYDDNSYNTNNDRYGYQNNLFSNEKEYYSLIFGPQFSQYLLGQNGAYNNQRERYGEENFIENNNINYYQDNQYDYNSQPYYQMEQNDYDYYDNNYYNYNSVQQNKKKKKKKVKKK